MIHLIGPGGAGKSTAGPLVAARLGGVFRDLDAWFAATYGDIDAFIAARGYAAYARANVEAYTALAATGNADVVALSSGFMTYPATVHRRYPAIRRRIAQSPTTVVLLPSRELERCVVETVRRQLTRGLPGRNAAREETVIRARFPTYAAWPTAAVETMRPPEEVADEIVARVAARQAERSPA